MTNRQNKITTQQLTDVVVSAAQDLKAQDISLLNLEKLETAPTAEFVICTGRSTSHVSSIADNIREEVNKITGIKPYSSTGYRNSQWIVVDYGNVIVHIFLPDTREYYNIEELWNDADITELPNID